MYNTAQAAAAPGTPGGTHALAHASLRDVVDRYLQWYKPDVAVGTYEKRAAFLRTFVEYFDNTKISAVSRAQLSDFFDDLRYLPKQKDVRRDFRDTKLRSALAEQKRRAEAGEPY